MQFEKQALVGPLPKTTNLHSKHALFAKLLSNQSVPIQNSAERFPPLNVITIENYAATNLFELAYLNWA